MKQYANVGEYIQCQPAEVRPLLEKMKRTIKKCAPKAEETISYGIPAFKLNGALVYFAAFKRHIGFYPTSSGVAAFKKELSPYKHAKGSIQFPLDRPLPVALIGKITRFRVKENQGRKPKK
ncbi:MAG: DUF1801 domain-containing protein [Nitrospinae bacterium]|nr:DUF1801 domain-containing protein [Nitrospinota bacterium]